MDPKNNHFIAQYNQVWLQRRQHVTLIWAIPTIAIAVLTVLLNIFFNKEGKAIIEIGLNFLIALGVIAIGLWGLWLRHNFFIKCLGLLLQELDGRRMPFVLPQFGDQFREIYKENLKLWEKIGAIKDATFWWLVVSYGFVLLLITITTNLIATSFLKICWNC